MAPREEDNWQVWLKPKQAVVELCQAQFKMGQKKLASLLPSQPTVLAYSLAYYASVLHSKLSSSWG